MADLDVTVGVDTAAAEEGLRRLSTQFHREINSIDRSKAEAKVGADTTKLDKKIVEAKRKLDDLSKRKADPNVQLDTKRFEGEVKKVQMRLKELSLQKAEIRVESAQLRNANKEAALSVKRQEAMAKQTEKLDRAKQKMEQTTRREIVQNRRASIQVLKLREDFAKLSAEEDRLANKTGRPGGILRSPGENRRLELVRARLRGVREEVHELGGTVDDIDPDMERHGSLLGRWAKSLSEVRLHLGFFSANLKQLGAVLVLLGPPLTGVLGAATSLVGVIGTSLAGALAVGVAGFAGFALSAGGVAAVLVPLVSELKAATTASKAYNDAVLKYGKGSDEARTANEKFRQTLAGIDPEARRTIRNFGSLKDRWKELTKEAREPIFDSAAEGMRTVESLMPMFARETTATTKVVANGWDEAMQALRSGGAKSGIQTIMENFRQSLPPIFDGLGHISSLLGRISVSASKFLPSLGVGFNDWAAGLDHAVGRGTELDEKVGRLIDHMRMLGHFMQATGRLGVSLFDASADSGAGLLKTLTDLFNKWADWMQTVEGQRSLKKFFAESADESRALFAMLGRLTEFFFQMSRAVAPISDAFVGMLRTVGDVVAAMSDIPVLNSALATTGKVLAVLWAVNRVRAFATAVRGAAAALGLMTAAEGAAAASGAAGAAAGGAAAAGAGGGLLAGLKSIKFAKIGAIGLGLGLVNGVVDEVKNNAAQGSDEIIEAFQAKLDDRSLAEKGFGIDLPGHFWTQNQLQTTDEESALKNVVAQVEELGRKRGGISQATERQLKLQAQEIDMTKAQRKALGEIFALTRRGRELGVKVGTGMDPKQLQALLAGYSKLRSGALASLGDIGKVTQANATLIRTTLPRGSEEARRKTADNFRAAAAAIKKAMDNGTIDVKRGTDKMRQLMRNAKLLEGRDPLGLAKGFASSWEEAGGINRRNRDRIIKDLAKMPPQARREAFQMMMQYGAGLVRGKKIPENDLRLFKSRALTELDGIAGGFGTLSSSVYGALDNIGFNLRAALKDLGGKAPPKFQLQKLLNMLPELSPLPAQGKQQGGFTVGGYGSGDHIPKALPSGSFVMNREASSYYGLNSGGNVQTILEPRERVFTPREVARYGADNLAAMNAAVPRAKGGGVGKQPKASAAGGIGPMPQISGRPSTALDIGQGSVSTAYKAASEFFNEQKKKFAAAGIGAALPPGAPANLQAAMQLATSMGLSITSTTGGEHAPGSYHYSGHAFDASNGTNTPQERSYAIAAAQRWGSNILELFFDPLGWYIKNGQKVSGAIGDHSDHVHTAMEQGGLVELLAGGGFINASSAQENVAMTIGQHLLNRGLNYKGAAGIIGNAWRESLWDPSAEGTGGGGLWGFTTPPISLADLKATAGAKGKSWTDIGFQTGFMWSGPEPASAYKGALNSQPSAAAAAEFFDTNWERSGVKAMSDRKNGAREALYLMTNGGMDEGAAGAGAGAKKGLPKEVKVKHPVYEAKGGKSGGLEAKLTKKTTESKVPLDIPDFGPIPEKEGEIRRELAQLEHKMLPEYRSAVRQYKDKKSLLSHLKASLAKIEQRIRDLRAKLRELRYAKARSKFTKKLGRQLGRITGQEPLIENAQRNYEERQQYAEQVVGQEPEQPGELTSDWLTNILEPYVNNNETDAYRTVLGAENHWRNVILTAQDVAKNIERNWEIGIGWPEKGRNPFLEDPDLHYPPHGKNEATGTASWIYGLYDQIQRIRTFAQSHPPKWWNEHPNAKERRDRELQSIDDYFAPELAQSKFKRKSTIGVLGEGRESFDWFRGTGSFEDSMQDVQGLHWPDQHEKLESLPGFPTPGLFGGAIYETQETIQDLGLTIKQAKESLEGSEGDSGADKAAEIASFEEAIRGLVAGRPFYQDTHKGPFMGAFARGGVALVGERGPELAHMPSGTRIHDAEDTARLLQPEVVVDLSRLNYGPLGGLMASRGGAAGDTINNVTNYFSTPPPDPHTWTKQQRFELEALA